jgi:transcription initiation factor TFIIIB Brf1 subunit/transcription initiation factor TFIIB
MQFMMDPRHDPYQARRKPRGELVCPDCKLVCREGRWQHGVPDPSAHKESCPACRRVADRYAAGTLTIASPISNLLDVIAISAVGDVVELVWTGTAWRILALYNSRLGTIASPTVS